MAWNKNEKAPLLAPGRHMMGTQELKELTVARFPKSGKRKQLWSAFEKLYQEILEAGFPCQIWINGSFLTEEENPSDIDFTIHVDAALMHSPLPVMREILDRFDDGAEPGNLDGFVCTIYPRDHERFGTELDENDEWACQWGVSRSEWLKGIVVLRPGETDVGLLVCP